MKIICQSYINELAQVISPGFITIENGVIVSLLPFTDKPDLDLRHMMIFPGFVNAHCHLELTDLAPLPAKPFVDWVKELIKKQSSTPNFDLLTSAERGAQMLLQSGVTTIIDHLSPQTPIGIYENIKQRIVAIAEVLGTRAEISKRHLSQQLDKSLAHVQKFLSPHSVYGIHPEVLKKILQTTKYSSLHISESPAENQFYISKDGPLKDFIDQLQGAHNNIGASPINTIKTLGCEISNSLIVHGNDLSESDLQQIHDWQNNVVVHCPGSFAYFDYHDFPLQRILAHNIPVALGTDSLVSNDDLNFLREIQLFLENFSMLTFRELLPMITTNAAQALGLQQIGQIAEGYTADLVGFVDTNSADPLTILKTRQGADFVMIRGITQISQQMSR